MNYGYIRVSGDKQDLENQRYELLNFANSKNMKINHWVSETAGTRRPLRERKLSALIDTLKAGDSLVVSEITRLGRSLFEIFDILNKLLSENVAVFSTKEGYELGSDLNSKILAFAFGLAGEIERDLISRRTKEALGRKRAEGKILGRPAGSLSKVVKLSGKDEDIHELLSKGVNITNMARILGVNRQTLSNYIKTRNLT